VPIFLLPAKEKLHSYLRSYFVVITVCHQGNDSQRAVVLLKKILQDSQITVKDIAGGLEQWSKNIDPSFPRY
jgi:rhodanese-related sulfurtransferase